MKKARKLISLLLVFTMIGSFFATSFAQNGKPPVKNFPVLTEGSYVPGQVLIGLSDEISLTRDDVESIKKSVPKDSYAASRPYAIESLFAGVEIVSAEDLTDVSDILPDSLKTRASKSGTSAGRQVLCVDLASKDQEDMWRAIDILKTHPEIDFAEPNLTIQSFNVPTPQYLLDGDLWGMEKTWAPLAWNLETGSQNVYVGVLDSGIDYNHEDLDGNVEKFIDRNTSLGRNLFYDPQDPLDSEYDPQAYCENPDPMDDFGHGTHVAGTIGAVGNKVAGVCPNVTIIPLKIFDATNLGSTEVLLRGIEYVNALIAGGIDIPILSFSGGWQGYPDITEEGYTLCESIRLAIAEYSGLFICAAGNFGSDNDLREGDTAYPASLDLPNIIAVAATDREDKLCEWSSGASSYGATTVDLAAPGNEILSTVPGALYVNEYDYSGGTSMATPHVTGAAALLKSCNPNLTPAQIKSYLLDNVDYSPYLQGKVATNGRLNVYKALKALQEDMNLSPFEVDVSFNQNILDIPADNTTVSAQATATVHDSCGGNSILWSLDRTYIGVSLDTNGASCEIIVDREARKMVESIGVVEVYVRATCATCETTCGAAVLSLRSDGVIYWETEESLLRQGVFIINSKEVVTQTIVSDQTVVVSTHFQSEPRMEYRFSVFDEQGNEVLAFNKDEYGTTTGAKANAFVMEEGKPYTFRAVWIERAPDPLYRSRHYSLGLRAVDLESPTFWTPSNNNPPIMEGCANYYNDQHLDFHTAAYQIVSDETVSASIGININTSLGVPAELDCKIYDNGKLVTSETFEFYEWDSQETSPFPKDTSQFRMEKDRCYTVVISFRAVPGNIEYTLTPNCWSTEITPFFTDLAFRAAVYGEIDKTAPAVIYDTDVAGITELDVSYLSGSKIQNLAGIEYFTSLEELDCSDNNLMWLPQLPGSLTSLNCSGNWLPYLEELPSGLTRLECADNQIENLYGLPSNLEYLDCSGNELFYHPSWPLTLTHLNCSDNKLTALDVSGPTLGYLNCSYNFMPRVGSVTGFTGTWDGVNYIFSPQNTDITAEFEDYAFRTAVRQLTGRTGYNEPILATDVESITNLDVSGSYVEGISGFYIQNLAGLRWFKNLETLNCSGNELTWIPSLPISLTSLDCSNNQLTELDVTDIELEYLNCSNNYLTVKPAVIGFKGEWDEIDFIFSPQKFSPKRKVAAGLETTAAIDSYRMLYAWGDNYSGQFGIGSTGFSTTPEYVSGINGATSIAVGEQYMLMLKADGTVWASGSNSLGRLGDGTNQDSDTPVQVDGLTDVIAIDAGSYHALALKSDGTVWAWGANYAGQLGNSNYYSSNVPVQVYGISGATAIAAGDYHSLAVNNGNVWAWGWNASGQLGDGTTTDRTAPVQVTQSGNIVSVAAGSSHSAYMNTNGNVYTWGWNEYGQLGSGTTTDRTTPGIITGLADVAVLSAGPFNTAVIKTDGTVWTWGDNSSGQVGKPTSIQQYNAPVQVPGIADAVQISIGSAHMIAATVHHSVWTWGGNWYGQLGDESHTGHHFPDLVNIGGWFDYGYRHIDAPNGSGRYLIFSAENDNPVNSFLSCYGDNGVQNGYDVSNYPPPLYNSPYSDWEWMLIEQDTPGYYRLYSPERGGYLDITSDSDTGFERTYGTQNSFELTANNELRSTGPGNRYICISDEPDDPNFYSYAEGDHEGYSSLKFYKKMLNPYAYDMSRGYSPEQAAEIAAYKAALAARNAPATKTRLSEPPARNSAPDRRPAPMYSNLAIDESDPNYQIILAMIQAAEAAKMALNP